ncbi:MAG TPA: GDSL-type esterase/lipase family protein [Planctomycetota bacterium]|nr:GDSL-type esterase/lipase family protein [Planctomycetota bacterium]
MPIRLRRLLAMTTGLLLAVPASELALRVWNSGKPIQQMIWGAVVHQLDPELGYWLKPSSTARGIHVNSLGMRGPEIEVKRPCGTLRILCLGDSITWGEAVADDAETYPAVLERQLRAIPGLETVQVLNGGIMGYASWQCRERAEELLPLLHPDLVLLCLGWNDLTLARTIGWHPRLSYVTPIDAWQLGCGQSFLADFLRRHVFHGNRQPDPRALDFYRTEVKALVALVRAHGAQTAFLDLPTVFAPELEAGALAKAARSGYSPAGVSSFLEYRNCWVRIAAELHVPVLATGLEYEAPAKVRFLADICHPDPDGNHYMCGLLAPQIHRLLSLH